VKIYCVTVRVLVLPRLIVLTGVYVCIQLLSTLNWERRDNTLFQYGFIPYFQACDIYIYIYIYISRVFCLAPFVAVEIFHILVTLKYSRSVCFFHFPDKHIVYCFILQWSNSIQHDFCYHVSSHICGKRCGTRLLFE